MSETPLVVFHSCIDWLPQTQTWMHSQIRLLPDGIDNHILCERIVNQDQFYLPNIHSLCQYSSWRCMLTKVFRRMGLRRKVNFFAEAIHLHRAEVLHSHFGNKGWEDSILARSEGLKACCYLLWCGCELFTTQRVRMVSAGMRNSFDMSILYCVKALL